MKNLGVHVTIFLIVISIALLALLIGVGIGIQVGGKQPITSLGVPAPGFEGLVDEMIVVDEQKEMTDLLTYRNNEYGFEVVYPTGWEVFESSVEGDFWVNKVDDEQGIGLSQIYIGVTENTDNKTLDELLRVKQDILLPFYDEDKEIVVDNERAVQIRVVKPEQPPITPFNAGWIGGLHKETKFLHGDRVYTTWAVGENYIEVEEVYDALIETFSFVDTGV